MKPKAKARKGMPHVQCQTRLSDPRLARASRSSVRNVVRAAISISDCVAPAAAVPARVADQTLNSLLDDARSIFEHQIAVGAALLQDE